MHEKLERQCKSLVFISCKSTRLRKWIYISQLLTIKPLHVSHTTFHCLSYCQVDQKSEFSLCLRKLENCRKSEGFVNLCVFRDVSQSYSELEIRNFVELSRKLSRTRKPVHFCNNLTRNQLPKFLHAFKQLSCGIYTHISE